MSNINLEPEIISLSAHHVHLLTADLIKSLRDKNTGAHEAVRESLRDIFSADYVYFANATPEAIKNNRRILNNACSDAKIITVETTTDLHKLVKLVVTANPQLASGYVHVLSVAKSVKKTPDNFLDWLNKAGGIEAVRKKFLANGDENPNYESGSTREKKRDAKIASAKDGLKSTRCTIDASVLANANFNRVTTVTECVAIIVRYPNGNIGIKDFVSDKTLLNSAYLQHAIEQEAKSNVDNASAATPPTAEEREAAIDTLAGTSSI
jgi:hypothetical protein